MKAPECHLGVRGMNFRSRQIDMLKRWIEQGARYAEHWSFVKPQRAAFPVLRDREVIASTRWPLRYLPGLLAVILFVAAPALAWEHWGGDRGGTRFSSLAQITPANVGNLVRAWEFRTGDLEARPPAAMAHTKFEATPLFVENSLDLLFALQRGHRGRSRYR